MVLKAESYFHGGTERDFSWEDEEGREREGAIADDAEHAHEEPAPTDWPAQINSRVKTHEHYHLKQNEQKEILPFLFMATQLDPYHIEAQLSTAYWLERRLHKPAEALQVLQTARRFNPGSWEVVYELGNLYWRAHAYDKAIPCYEEALQKLDRAAVRDIQAAHLHYYLANSYESTGDPAKAREHYEIFLKLLPPDQSLAIRRQVTQKLESLV
jgi:tetratricopeptide (TPR) repeat protein